MTAMQVHAFFKSYAAQGVATADKEVLEIARIAPGCVLVRTADTLSGAGGSFIAAWEHVDIVSDTTAGLKVVAAMPEGELAAWQARGAPLGRW